MHIVTTHTRADTGVHTQAGKEGARLRCAQVGRCAVFRMEAVIKVPVVTSAVSPWPLLDHRKRTDPALCTRAALRRKGRSQSQRRSRAKGRRDAREDPLSPSTSGGGGALPPARLQQTFCFSWNPVRLLRARTKGKKKRERQPRGSRPGRRARGTRHSGGPSGRTKPPGLRAGRNSGLTLSKWAVPLKSLSYSSGWVCRLSAFQGFRML